MGRGSSDGCHLPSRDGPLPFAPTATTLALCRRLRGADRIQLRPSSARGQPRLALVQLGLRVFVRVHEGIHRGVVHEPQNVAVTDNRCASSILPNLFFLRCFVTRVIPFFACPSFFTLILA